MNETKASGGGISGMIHAIDGIAFHTSLLALNAAVAAASEAPLAPQWNLQAANDTLALIEQSIARSQSGEPPAGEAFVPVRCTNVPSGLETATGALQRITDRIRRIQCNPGGGMKPFVRAAVRNTDPCGDVR